MRTLLTPTHNNQKRGARRVRQNKASGNSLRQTIMSTDPYANSKDFDLKLGSANPINVEHIRMYNAMVVQPSTVTGLQLNPANFGSRSLNLATLYMRYRFVKIIFSKLPYKDVTGGGSVVLGVAEDNLSEGGTVSDPANQFEILNFRTSTTLGANTGGELVWRPIDPNRWFYMSAGAGTAGPTDGRFIYPGTFYGYADTSGSGIIISIRAIIEFAGPAGNSTS